MLTNKGKYGLKALVHLAGLPLDATAQSMEIATAESIPKKFLDAILGDLRNAGLVLARKGKNGGYRLSRPASEIMAGDAIRALDGPLAPIGCVKLRKVAERYCRTNRKLVVRAVHGGELGHQGHVTRSNALDRAERLELGEGEVLHDQPTCFSPPLRTPPTASGTIAAARSDRPNRCCSPSRSIGSTSHACRTGW